jgi:hypothetical protein
MITVERFFWGHMLVAVAALSIGFAAVGWGFYSLGLVGLGVLWLAMQQRKSWGSEGMMLFAFVTSAAIGNYIHLPGWLLLLGVVTSLGAWDLYHFLMRLDSAEHVEYASGLGREHLRRLGLVELGGMVAGLAALTFHLGVDFWWEMCFSILVVIGISVIIARIRKETE